MASMTPEQRAAEKLRLKQLQEEADLKTALDTLGLTSTSSLGLTSDAANPTSKEEFSEYADALVKKITQHKLKEEYVPFLDDLVSKLCAGCEFLKKKHSMKPTNFRFIFSVVDQH